MKPDYRRIALVHRSALNENRRLISNERLEFLGDAVLELVVSDWLFRRFPQEAEGRLSLRRSQIVQTSSLAQIAKNLHLDQDLIMSRGEAKNGGRNNDSILADCLEAVIGAIYLEDGLAAAVKFIRQNILTLKFDAVDYKSRLQELWQHRYHTAPVYRLIKSTGPDHKKQFTVGAYLNKQLIASATGPSKQKAEAFAAKIALEKKPEN